MINEIFGNPQQSLLALLAGLVITGCLQVFLKILEFMWQFVKKKIDTNEDITKELITALNGCTSALAKLDEKVASLEAVLLEIPKFKLDLKRMFTAIKMMAGEDWAKIKKEIMDDELPHGPT